MSRGSGQRVGRPPPGSRASACLPAPTTVAVSLTRRVRKPEARAMVRSGSVEPSSRGDVTSIPCAAPTALQAAMRRSPAVKFKGAARGETIWPGARLRASTAWPRPWRPWRRHGGRRLHAARRPGPSRSPGRRRSRRAQRGGTASAPARGRLSRSRSRCPRAGPFRTG